MILSVKSNACDTATGTPCYYTLLYNEENFLVFTVASGTWHAPSGVAAVVEAEAGGGAERVDGDVASDASIPRV